MTSTSEILMVDPSPGWSSPWPVVARVAPRIVVVEADADHLDEAARHARLALARQAGGPTASRGDTAVVDELDTGARLFVDGWLARPPDKPDRPGEGLSWDSPGYEPPDRPST